MNEKVSVDPNTIDVVVEPVKAAKEPIVNEEIKANEEESKIAHQEPATEAVVQEPVNA
jgi:hypothetical protein